MQVYLTKLVPGGQALGELPDGRKVFVWGGLPSETVEVEITKSKRSYAEAVVTAVIAGSRQRVEPRDDCYLSTSPWQIMDYDYELSQKQELIKESFAQAGIPLKLPKITTDNRQYHYRNKMEYSLWWDNDTSQILLAFHRRGTHQKLPVEQSSIERPEIWAEAQRIIGELNSTHQPARRYQSLVLRANQQGKVSGGLLENGKPHPVMPLLVDTILGREYSYSPNGFFQINLPVYQLALEQIRSLVDPNLPVVDLYAGVGTVGLSVAAANQPLILIETDPAAYRELAENTRQHHLGAKAVKANVENALDYITYDINLVVDPPRAGLDAKLRTMILENTPKRLIYLSCNPTTQARDIADLLPKYTIIDHQGYNFFPRTPHIEHLVVLERSRG